MQSDKFNVSVYDCSDPSNEVFLKGFSTSKEAEDFIEAHEEPNVLDCKFNPSYEKRVLEQFHREQTMTVFDLRILNLISLNNPIKTISKVLGKEGKSVLPFVAKLCKKKLIENNQFNEWEITAKGSDFLEQSIAKGDLCYV